MITIRKLRSLKRTNKLMKTAMILKQYEIDLSTKTTIDYIYLRSIREILLQEADLPSWSKEILHNLHSIEEYKDNNDKIRILNSLRHGIYTLLNAEPADWDFISPETGKADSSKRDVFPISVFLEDIRSPFNVGSIFRSAESFGVEKIYLSEQTVKPDHKRAVRSSMGCTELVSWEIGKLSSICKNENVFALELGGTPIDQFIFPDKGVVIIGSEELGISPSALSLAERSYKKVSIPTAGAKGSLNVSVAFGILMHRWYSFLLKMN